MLCCAGVMVAILLCYSHALLCCAVTGMVRNLVYMQLPWGVTANVAVRNTDERFDLRFPPTGGGEDVDFCLRATHVARPGEHTQVGISGDGFQGGWPGW